MHCLLGKHAKIELEQKNLKKKSSLIRFLGIYKYALKKRLYYNNCSLIILLIANGANLAAHRNNLFQINHKSFDQ